METKEVSWGVKTTYFRESGEFFHESRHGARSTNSQKILHEVEKEILKGTGRHFGLLSVEWPGYILVEIDSIEMGAIHHIRRLISPSNI